MDCCAIDKLCDKCVEEWAIRFQGVCYARAATWISQLAAKRRGPWVPWPVGSERVRAVAMTWVDDLTSDVRLRERLVDELERCAAERWNGMRSPPPTDDDRPTGEQVAA